MSASGVSVVAHIVFWVQEVVRILLIHDRLLYALVDGVGNGAYKRLLGDAFIQLVKRTRRLLDHYHSTYYTYIAFWYSLRR